MENYSAGNLPPCERCGETLRLGARVEQLRRVRGLTLQAVADELGYSPMVVRRLLDGRRLREQTRMDVETWVERHEGDAA